MQRSGVDRVRMLAFHLKNDHHRRSQPQPEPEPVQKATLRFGDAVTLHLRRQERSSSQMSS